VIVGQKFRKGNLEDAKKHAIDAAKNRDDANANPRRKDIPIEIASTTNKIDDLKTKIQNDTVVQQDLRRTFETQSAIEQLKGQCQTELEELKEKISDYRFQFQAYKISSPPSDLPGDDSDKRGEELKKIIEIVSDEINDKFEDRERELTKNQDTIRRIEAIVSEKSALYNHDIQSIRSKQQRIAVLKPSIEKTRQAVEELRSFEARDEEISTPVTITESRPEELLSYLTERIEEIEGHSTEGIPPHMIKKIMKKLFKLVRN
jgi:DNA repair protein RAD50